jgi:catechol 2,3-dioxygenase-like lactoylglutathione lyase family enzyme
MDWKLELIVVPATDLDRAKAFYTEQVGFEVLVDHSAGEDFRVVQLIPSGSACAIALMKQPERAGTVLGLHLVVTDIDAARSELHQRGVAVGELYHFGAQGQQPGRDPSRRDYNSFFSFEDPDGNGWLVQEVAREAAS